MEERTGQLPGIEVQAAAILRSGDVRGLQALASTVGKKWVGGVVLYTGADVIPYANKIHGVPIAHLWAGSWCGGTCAAQAK